MLMDVTRRALRRLSREIRARRAIGALRRRLAGSRQYEFTRDYVEDHAQTWSRLLEPYRGRPGLRALEIGSYEGRSAVWLLENVLGDPSSTLVCVDPFTDPLQETRFDHNIRASGRRQQLIKRKNLSDEVLWDMEPESFDLIYVDGSHKAVWVWQDCWLAWRALRKGGLLLLDDYMWELQRPVWDRPKAAIDMFLENLRGGEILHRSYQVAVRKEP